MSILYAYECRECGMKDLGAWRSAAKRDNGPECPTCDDRPQMTRMVSAPGIVLDPMGFPGANLKRSREQRKKLNEGS